MFRLMTAIAICAMCALLFAGSARANPCVGFTDVSTADSYCPNVAWLKNRAVTLGCTGNTYCPNDPVTRLAMALFMNRLGKALTVDTLFSESGTGALMPGTVVNPWIVCGTGDTVATAYPRAVSAEATVAGLSDANTMAWSAGIYYSTDGGTSWNALGGAMPAYSKAGVWSDAAAENAMDLDVGVTYRFGVGIARDTVIAATTGNFVNGRCQLSVGITNRNGDPAGNPFGG